MFLFSRDGSGYILSVSTPYIQQQYTWNMKAHNYISRMWHRVSHESKNMNHSFDLIIITELEKRFLKMII